MVIIPFDNSVPNENIDTSLRETFTTPLASRVVYDWLLEGLQDYHENKLAEPEIIKEILKEYREDNRSELYNVLESKLPEIGDVIPLKDLVHYYADKEGISFNGQINSKEEKKIRKNFTNIIENSNKIYEKKKQKTGFIITRLK